MKNIRRLFISILSLINILIVVAAVTYAWFSIALINIVHDISLGVSSEDTFLISLDGVNFKKTLTTEDIVRAIGGNLEMNAVTTNDGINFFHGGPIELLAAEKNIDYISLDIYFQATAKEKNVYLVDNVSNDAYKNKEVDGTYVISKGINWKADINFLNGPDPVEDVIKAGDRQIFYSAEAVRIGFLEERISENINDKRLDSELINKIFDLSLYSELRGFGTSYGSIDYYNQKHNSNITPPSFIPSVVTNLTSFQKHNPFVPLDENSLILRLVETNKYNKNGDKIYQGKVKMNIWVEGWDADCFNAILRDALTIKLKFNGARDVPENI